ncbi:MAG: DUF1289 domain-containing protein [Betaproteobacteria bacterium]
MSATLKEVPSPCVNVCQMDPHTGLCRGCTRTIEEIGGWMDFSATEKLAVLEKIEARRRTGVTT